MVSRFLEREGIRQDELASVLGVTEAAISRKVNGLRPWFQAEVDLVLAWMSTRCGRRVTYEEVFAASSPDAQA